jgi:hypothetical protein
MKISTSLVFLALLLSVSLGGSLKKSASPQEVAQFLNSHDESMGALFFYDSSKEDEGGVFNTVGNLLSSIVGSDNQGSATINNMAVISEEVDTLAIDISLPDFAETQELYEITTVPYMIVFNEGVAAIKEVPNDHSL